MRSKLIDVFHMNTGKFVICRQIIVIIRPGPLQTSRIAVQIYVRVRYESCNQKNSIDKVGPHIYSSVPLSWAFYLNNCSHKYIPYSERIKNVIRNFILSYNNMRFECLPKEKSPINKSLVKLMLVLCFGVYIQSVSIYLYRPVKIFKTFLNVLMRSNLKNVINLLL